MAKKKQGSKESRADQPERPSAEPGPSVVSQPIATWFTVSDVEQLKSLTSDIRLRILRELADQPRTAMQVAQILEEPPTKLYHHFDALADANLIQLVKTVPKRGTTQRFFRAVASQFRVADDLFGETQSDERSAAILSLLDSVRTEVLQATSVKSHDREEPCIMAMSGIVRTTSEHVAGLTETLNQLYSQLDQQPAESCIEATPLTSYRVTILVHPVK